MNRLILLVESRIRGDVYVRFGGEYQETHRRNTAERRMLSLLVAILKQYNCHKQQDTNAFIIDCTLDDIHTKVSHLIQALSFMLNMKIFYV